MDIWRCRDGGASVGGMSSALLLAESEESTRSFLERHLTQDGFEVVGAENGEALDLLERVCPDLVLIGDPEGQELCRRLREGEPGRSWDREVPVILLGGEQSDPVDRVRAFDRGCDDYLERPFHYDELVARIRAVLRRGARPGQSMLQVDDLKLDRLTHTVQRGGRSIDLSPKEFALLEFLMIHRGQAVSRTAIVEHVWKLNFDTMTNVVDVYINYLRRKIDSGFDRALIRTVRGVGYQIGAEPAAVRAHALLAR